MKHEIFNTGARRAFEGNPAAAERAGRWVAGSLMEDKKSLTWCRDHGVKIERAQGETTGTNGGFTVPEEVENEIIEYRNSIAVFRQEARTRLMGSSALVVPKRTGTQTGYYVGESSQITESDGTWGNIVHQARKPAALTRISSELWEDSAADLGTYFAEELSAIFADTEDDAGWNGDGSGTFGGIVGIGTKVIDGNHNAAKVLAASGHDTFAEIDASDIAALMAALPERYWPTAKFYASGYGAAYTFCRLGATAGGTIMTASGPRPLLSYLGFPLVVSPKLPGSGSQNGKLMIAFGDMRQAVSFGSRRGVTVAISTHRYFELDQLAVKGTERYDINVHGLGDNTTAGPIVALVGN